MSARNVHSPSWTTLIHTTMRDNKVGRQVQPMADQFAQMDFGQFMAANVTNMMSFGVGRLYLLKN